MKWKLVSKNHCTFIFRKADIVARLLEDERSNMKRKHVEEEDVEMEKLTMSRDKGCIAWLPCIDVNNAGKMRKLLQEYRKEGVQGKDQTIGEVEKDGVVWLVESQEFWAGGESAFKKEVAFTSKKAALQGAKVAFVNMNCFYDLVNSKEMKGKLPPEGKVNGQNKGVTYEAIRSDGVGGRVELREVALDIASTVHETRAHFLDKWI